ncbi:MAG: hypothetical protein H7Z40_19110 [Phycisphaerae bacterium]|nr:hypothetical protein [Gemmatimonadaceae bacterium]
MGYLKIPSLHGDVYDSASCVQLFDCSGVDGQPLSAQRSSTKFVTGTMGVGAARGDPFERVVLNVDVAGGVTFHRRPRYGLVGGAFAGFTTDGPTGIGVAPVECDPAPSVPACRPYEPYAPTFEFAGVMLGVESPSSRAMTIGFNLGPSILQTSRIGGTEDHVTPGRAFGLQSRLDFSAGKRVWFALSARNMFVPNYRSRSINLPTLNFGMRFGW